MNRLSAAYMPQSETAVQTVQVHPRLVFDEIGTEELAIILYYLAQGRGFTVVVLGGGKGGGSPAGMHASPPVPSGAAPYTSGCLRHVQSLLGWDPGCDDCRGMLGYIEGP
jgi:hypothetical protein